jgi:hypothetical protein
MGNGIRGVIALGVLLLALCPRARAVDLIPDWNLARNYASAKQAGRADIVGIYLNGAGSAYVVANAVAATWNKPLLYCQPPTLTLNALNYLDIFEKELARGPPEAALNYGDEMVLLIGLQRMFPCPSK